VKSLSVFVLLILITVTHVNAQVQPDSARVAASLRAVRLGTEMRVHAPSFGRVEGSFRRVDSLLVVGDVWSPKRIPIGGIDTVWVRSNNGARKGATIGAAVGAALAGLVVGAFCSDPDNACGVRAVLPLVLAGGFVGALPGVLIGAAMLGGGTWSVVYP
jgi:hypothetical protein